MNINLFDYKLPIELIAQKPTKNRDKCKLLVAYKDDDKLVDEVFSNIANYFNKGDVIVLNNTKVIPCRLLGFKQETKGKVEVFFLHEIKNKVWSVLIKGKVSENMKIAFNNSDLIVKPIKKQDYTWEVKVNKSNKDIKKIFYKIGKAPLPPYIQSDEKESLVREKYQTVYSRHEGSVAAPTAGLHFTKRLLKKLKKKGVKVEYITLHVGMGTFAPVRVKNIKKHKMHEEYVDVKKSTINNILKAKKQNKKIIAVGTTVVRTLETVVQKNKAYRGWINLYIFPGYKYKIVDALITNFHLPKSTLIMLVSAFMGRERCLNAYKHAVKKKYRFFSFGDAMLILNK